MTVWGTGGLRTLGGGGAVDWDGHLFGAHLGVDARFGAGEVAGVALSVGEGRFDYSDRDPGALGAAVEGTYESRMAGVHPYLGWRWGAETHAWGSLGVGRGSVEVVDEEAGRGKGASTLRSAAVGGRVRVWSGGPATLDVKGAAWTARMRIAGDGGRFAGHTARVHRVRGEAQGARAFALGGGGSVTPSVAVGVRLDGGDGETGAGVEVGGGVAVAHPALGLGAEVAGRGLLARRGAREWSVGGALRLSPASGRGWSLRLAPSYGDAGGGLARWEAGGVAPAAQLDSELGYGVGAFAGVLTPYGALPCPGAGGAACASGRGSCAAPPSRWRSKASAGRAAPGTPGTD